MSVCPPTFWHLPTPLDSDSDSDSESESDSDSESESNNYTERDSDSFRIVFRITFVASEHTCMSIVVFCLLVDWLAGFEFG